MDEQMIKQQQRQQKSDGQILKELYGLVFIRGAEITPKKISNRYQRPISQANKLLEDFLSKYGHAQNNNNNNNQPLKVRYEFAGSKPKNGGVQNLDFESHSLSLIDDTELELKKSAFESCSYRPVSVHLASKKSPDPVLFFTQLRSPAEPTIENLKKVQSLSNVLNPHIKIRPPFRPLALKTVPEGKSGSKSKADDAIAANSSSSKKPKPTTNTVEPMDIDKPGPSTSTSYLSSTLLKPSKYFSSSSIGSSSASSSSSAKQQQQKATSSSTSSLLKKRPILDQPSSSKDDKDKESSSTSTANTFTALKASAPPAKKAKKGPAKSSKVLDSLVDPCEKLRAEKRLTEQANFTVKKSGGGIALQASTSKPVNKKNGPTAEVVSAGKSTGQQSILSFFARKKIN